MAPHPSNSYAFWRLQRGTGGLLHDESRPPPERLLQAVWQYQRVRRSHLRTLDGRQVRVLHPGFRSVEGGPDFRGAVLQFDEKPPQSGDVEVDVRQSGWKSHRHDSNPAFRGVILHVIWQRGADDAKLVETDQPPVMTLESALDSPVSELSVWLDREPQRVLPEGQLGKCAAPLRELRDEQIAALLREAALVRMQSKASAFRARAREAGWEQAFWEGLFRGLGYKHNAWPMQNLAEERPYWSGDDGAEPLQFQARLLGLSGLLPHDFGRHAVNAPYLRRLWDCWWRDREMFAQKVLPTRVWRMHGVRPANHPQRRLALVAHWAANPDLIPAIERWCASEVPDRALQSSLLRLLQVDRDDFWTWHWTLHSSRFLKAQPLIGATRVTDLAINAILPWLWARAVEGGSRKLQDVIGHRYLRWPAAEDNSVLRLARRRLLGGRRIVFASAALQQGLLQVVGDFCDHSNAICDQCGFPELIPNWVGSTDCLTAPVQLT